MKRTFARVLCMSMVLLLVGADKPPIVEVCKVETKQVCNYNEQTKTITDCKDIECKESQ